MAVPQQLLQQLLLLDESVRRELAHALLESVDVWVDDGMTHDERVKLGASLDRSIAESDAGHGIPIEQAVAAVRARRAARAAAAR